MNRLTQDVKQRMEDFIARHGAGIERRLLSTKDDRTLLELYKLACFYAFGKPTERLEVSSPGFSAESILTEIWRQLSSATNF